MEKVHLGKRLLPLYRKVISGEVKFLPELRAALIRKIKRKKNDDFLAVVGTTTDPHPFCFKEEKEYTHFVSENKNSLRVSFAL